MNGVITLRVEQRIKVPVDQRLPLNVRSSGHIILDREWRHPEGVVDRYNLYWGVRGEIYYSVNGSQYVTKEDEIIVFPLNSIMGPADTISQGEYRWFTLDGNIAENLFKELGLNFSLPLKAHCSVPLHEKLLNSFTDLTAVAALSSEMIAYELLLSIKNGYEDRGEDSEIAESKEIIDNEFRDSFLDITSLADRVGLDRTALARRFKLKNGVSPSKYLQSKRLMLALRYLDGGCSTVATAEEVGYNDAGYFARAFKNNFGMTPQAWRVSMAKNV